VNLLDVNVLVALYRADHSDHQLAVAWWEKSLGSGEPFIVPDVCWIGFVRVVTNSRVFPEPATPHEALTVLAAVHGQGLHMGNGHLSGVLGAFGELCAKTRAGGNLETGAYIAAVARSLGATVVTFDRDFRRFDGIQVLEIS
jgi:uncharacterized protein